VWQPLALDEGTILHILDVVALTQNEPASEPGVAAAPAEEATDPCMELSSKGRAKSSLRPVVQQEAPNIE